MLTSLYKLNFLSKALLVLIFAPGCLQVLTPWAFMNRAYEYLLWKKMRTLECLTKVQNLVWWNMMGRNWAASVDLQWGSRCFGITKMGTDLEKGWTFAGFFHCLGPYKILYRSLKVLVKSLLGISSGLWELCQVMRLPVSTLSLWGLSQVEIMHVLILALSPWWSLYVLCIHRMPGGVIIGD